MQKASDWVWRSNIQKFPTLSEAEAFIGGETNVEKKIDNKSEIVSSISDGEIIAYVDGSYDKNEKKLLLWHGID